MADQTVGEGTSNCPTVRNNIDINGVDGDAVKALIRASGKGNAVVIFSISTCAMCDSVKTLFRELGVTNSTVYELDEEITPWGKEIERVLMGIIGSLPVVFIGEKLIGDRDRVIKRHREGKLVKLLEEAGAFSKPSYIRAEGGMPFLTILDEIAPDNVFGCNAQMWTV